MKSQWDCLLQNIGEWHGSFTRFSSAGELVEDTPTVVTLEARDNNQAMHQVVQRLVPGSEDLVLDYRSLNRSILFFEDGAFSQGSLQFGPCSEFGAEFGFVEQDGAGNPGDRRLRLVQLFNRQSELEQITLIREQRAGSTATERPRLNLGDLLGEWIGEAVTLYPDLRTPDRYPTHLKIYLQHAKCLAQELSFGAGGDRRTIASTATIDGSTIRFEQGSQPMQVLLLPDGASCNCPLQIKSGQPIILEVGWLVKPDLRQRMIRSYDSKGEWMSLTLVTEHKVG